MDFEYMLVVVFDSKDKAYAGHEALMRLVEDSIIRVDVAAVATKDRTGATTVDRTHRTIGATLDLAGTRVDSEFLKAVLRVLEPGTSALVAETYEESTTPVDEHMQALDGLVLRRDRSDVRDAVAALEIARLQRRSTIH
jgi:uncharacterized membrane protein